MKIRTQNILATFPLFAGLAALIGALMYYVQYRELVWGLEEESTSIAVALAEFIEKERIPGLLAGEPAEQQQWTSEALRVLRWGRARAIAVLDVDGRTVQDVRPDPSENGIPVHEWTVPPSVETALRAGGYAPSPMMTGVLGERFMQGFAPLLAEDGEWAGSIAVEITADHVPAHLALVLREGKWVLAVSVLLGLFLAVGISNLLSQRIHALTLAAQKLERSSVVEQPAPGRVQEINDLGNTFSTMGSVLNDVVAKTRRSVVEAEQFRTDSDLARAFAESLMPSVDVRTEALRGEAGLVSALPGAHGFGVWPCVGGAHVAMVFELAHEDNVSAAVKTSAASALLRNRLAQQEPVTVLKEWCTWCQVRRMSAITWDGVSDQTVTRLEWDGSSRNLHVDAGCRAKDYYWMLHTLSPASEQRVSAYLAAFRRPSPDGLLKEIRAVLDQDTPGALIVLMRTKTHSSTIVSP